jgi:hypothetical protein
LISKLFSFLNNIRFPNRSSLISVYAIIAFIVYSWTFITFFYKLSSWLYNLTIGEISVIFAYAMAVDLFESMLFLVVILLLSLLLPNTFLVDDFKIRGSWLAISFIGMLVIYLIPALGVQQRVTSPGLWLVTSVFLAALFTLFLSRLRIMRRFTVFLTDRMMVFLVIFTPLSAISISALFVRFLFRVF